MSHEPPSIGGRFRIKSKATGAELRAGTDDDPGWGDGAPHIIPAQDQGSIWEVEAADIEGCYRFKTDGPFPWFDVNDDDSQFGRLDSNAERQVYAHSLNEGSYQEWRLVPDTDEGYWELVNVATGFALDGTNEDIYTMAPNGGAYQRWTFLPA